MAWGLWLFLSQLLAGSYDFMFERSTRSRPRPYQISTKLDPTRPTPMSTPTHPDSTSFTYQLSAGLIVLGRKFFLVFFLQTGHIVFHQYRSKTISENKKLFMKKTFLIKDEVHIFSFSTKSYLYKIKQSLKFDQKLFACDIASS